MQPMALSRVFRVADSFLDGRLGELILTHRKSHSLHQTADWLREEHGVAVSWETIRRWEKALLEEAS